MMEKLNEIKTVMERNTLIPNMTNIARLEQAIWSSSLIQPLKDAFFCMICRKLPTPPVVISFCCKIVIGCNSCLENYHDHSCPHCRTKDFSKHPCMKTSIQNPNNFLKKCNFERIFSEIQQDKTENFLFCINLFVRVTNALNVL